MNLPGTHDKGKQPLRCPALEKAFLCPAQEHSEHAQSLEPRGGPQPPPNGERGAAITAPCPGTSQSPQWDRQPCLWGHSRDVGGGPAAPSAPQHTGSGAGGVPFAVPSFPRRAARGSPARCHAEQEGAFCLRSAGRGQRRCCALPRALEGVHTPGCGRPRALPRRDRSPPAPGPAPGPGIAEREPGVAAAGAAERLPPPFPWLLILHGNGPTSREQQFGKQDGTRPLGSPSPGGGRHGYHR